FLWFWLRAVQCWVGRRLRCWIEMECMVRRAFIWQRKERESKRILEQRSIAKTFQFAIANLQLDSKFLSRELGTRNRKSKIVFAFPYWFPHVPAIRISAA